MKQLSLVFAFLLFVGCAAHVRDEDKTFSQVFETPGQSKDVLYEKVKIWITQNFKSAKSVIEYDNKENGSIIGNGMIKYPCSGLDCIAKGDWTVPFTMRVDLKNNKFRLTFSNLHVAWPASRDSMGYHAASDHEMWQQGDYDSVRPILLQFGEEIKTSLSKEAKSDKW
jgi:hypothetical protein